MTIAAISSSVGSTVREYAQSSVQPTTAVRSAGEPRDSGRRHDLVGAINQALGVTAPQHGTDAQAVFHFVHAVMQDLRSAETGAESGGQVTGPAHDPAPGSAWGRREWNDLPQRLDALATAAGASAAVPRAPLAEATLAEREIPPQPNPITTNSAALHLMQVPSSRLLEAYVALRKALGEQNRASAGGAPRHDLAAFFARMAQELAQGAPVTLHAGSVVNLTA